MQWRALAHGAVTVLMLNSELSVAAHSAQWNYTRDALAAVDRAVTPWVVVAFHRPLYLVSRSASPSGPAGVRDPNFAPLEPLLVGGGVDAVLVGHIHNALVTCPVNNSVCGTGLPVHVCIGNAGQTGASLFVGAVAGGAAQAAAHAQTSHPPPPLPRTTHCAPPHTPRRAPRAVTEIQTNNVPEWVAFQRAAFGYSTLEANASHMSISLYGDDGSDANALWYTARFAK